MSSNPRARQAEATAGEGRGHLERLGAALQLRGWRVSLTGQGSDAKLQVTNPTVPEMFETILCRRAGDGWYFMWPWREAIEPVDKLDAAARRIRHVLRGAGEPCEGAGQGGLG
jgi:hypothetical protein